MTQKKIISLILCIIMAFSLLGVTSLAEDDKTIRTVYLHARGENPPEQAEDTTIVYKGDDADIYFAVDNPNKGDYDKVTGEHKTPQYDMNGYTICICYDTEYLELVADSRSPITYEIADFTDFDTTEKDDENIGEDTGIDVPQDIGYFVYKHGSGEYNYVNSTYATAYITVFYSGGFVPQKKDGQHWYNLAKLPLRAIKVGTTDVFIITEGEEKQFPLELFAKNKTDELSDQTFDANVLFGGYHHINIKDKLRPNPPIASPASGTYTERVFITLTAEENCDIYYTLNDDDPATSSSRILYDGNPIEIDVDTTLKACAERADGKVSNTVSYEYEIVPDRPYLFFDDEETLVPEIYAANSSFEVLVSDDDIFRDIIEGSTVYYSFADLDTENPVFGDNPESEWVAVSKQNPVIEIDKARTVYLFTDRLGHYSDRAKYQFTIKPAAPEANYESGEYDKKIDVELTCDTKGATIYYTLDGSDPKTSDRRQAYGEAPITLWNDTTLRAISYYEGEWSSKVSYYYLFNIYDDFGVGAFYPPGVYEGSVNVTLTPNNPEYTVVYHDGDGKWKPYDEMLVIDTDTEITAKAVHYDDEGNVVSEGEEYHFTYKIKPLPPEFAPESTQFTNADKIFIYTPESTTDTTDRFTLYYTVDGSDPVTSKKRIKANDASDTATVIISDYTVVSAVVLKDGESYSDVVSHSYDIVTLKPVKPLTTLEPKDYILEIGQEGYKTQFMPVPKGTQIYYTISEDGTFCPDPVPGTDGTHLYNGTDFIDIKGQTVIKAVAVNVFGVKSDVGIFAYTIIPEAPVAAPSAEISGDKLPVVPVDAVKGSTVIYEIGGFANEFVNDEDERFYIDTNTGSAYRDEACTEPLGDENDDEFTQDSVKLEIRSELNGVESETNRYVYSRTDEEDVLAPPYADKKTGIYEERVIDDDENLLAINLNSLNDGDTIKYRFGNEGAWEEYDGTILINEDTVLQIRSEKDGNHSAVVSYVYNFIPLPPVIELPSGTYLETDGKLTRIRYDEEAPVNTKEYNIWYRQNGAEEDKRYMGEDIRIGHTMSFKAYVLNEETGRVSKSKIHYYIIETESAASGSIYITYPYDVDRISAHNLGTGDYAAGIKLISPNKEADIHYTYSYTRKSDGKTIRTNETVYDVSNPIIPTALMEDITITAWLVQDGGIIDDSEEVFYIDFVHLEAPVTSLEESGKLEFPKGTKYTIINGYDDENILIYYTLDGSDPSDSSNRKRKLYDGSELELTGETTVKAVYFSACGKCKDTEPEDCRYGIYGPVGTYKYIVKSSGGSTGGGGGGGTTVIDKTRKYTKDIFGTEHPTHIGYINGYPDGSVQPDGFITREEITAILYRITSHEYEKPFVATGDAFPDVEVGRWSAHDIEYMADKEIVLGYPDGEFKPSRHLTRAEFAALIFRFTKISKANIRNKFTDLSEEHWAYDEIIALCNTGLVEGYEDSTFRPENNITRAEAMTVINKLLGRKPLESYVKSLKFNPYNDLFEDKWYYVTVLEATITHDYYLGTNGYEVQWENWK